MNWDEMGQSFSYKVIDTDTCANSTNSQMVINVWWNFSANESFVSVLSTFCIFLSFVITFHLKCSRHFFTLNFFRRLCGIAMKLNDMRAMESLSMLADDNNNSSMLLNNSGPPAWILNLRDMDLDPPKLIRGNMEVNQIESYRIQKQIQIQDALF